MSEVRSYYSKVVMHDCAAGEVVDLEGSDA